MEQGTEHREKIIPNSFGGSISYKILAQNFIDDQLVMKIQTDNLAQALEDLKEEHQGKQVSDRSTDAHKLDADEYIIKIS